MFRPCPAADELSPPSPVGAAETAPPQLRLRSFSSLEFSYLVSPKSPGTLPNYWFQLLAELLSFPHMMRQSALAGYPLRTLFIQGPPAMAIQSFWPSPSPLCPHLLRIQLPRLCSLLAAASPNGMLAGLFFDVQGPRIVEVPATNCRLSRLRKLLGSPIPMPQNGQQPSPKGLGPNLNIKSPVH